MNTVRVGSAIAVLAIDAAGGEPGNPPANPRLAAERQKKDRDFGRFIKSAKKDLGDSS